MFFSRHFHRLHVVSIYFVSNMGKRIVILAISVAMHGTQDSTTPDHRSLFDGATSGHPTSFGQVTDSDHHAREGEYTRITRGHGEVKVQKAITAGRCHV